MIQKATFGHWKLELIWLLVLALHHIRYRAWSLVIIALNSFISCLIPSQMLSVLFQYPHSIHPSG